MCLNKPYEEENEQRESKYVFLQKTLLEKEENTLTNTTTDQLITEHSPMLGREDEIQTAATPSSNSRRASRTVGNEELTVRKTGLSTLFNNPAYSQVTPVAPAKRQEPADAPGGQLQKSSSSIGSGALAPSGWAPAPSVDRPSPRSTRPDVRPAGTPQPPTPDT